MKTFTTILNNKIHDIKITGVMCCISTDLDTENIIELFKALLGKDIFVYGIFKLYNRWTLKIMKREFDRAIEAGIIQ